MLCRAGAGGAGSKASVGTRLPPLQPCKTLLGLFRQNADRQIGTGNTTLAVEQVKGATASLRSFPSGTGSLAHGFPAHWLRVVSPAHNVSQECGIAQYPQCHYSSVMETKAEQLLKAGLLEAICDLEFIAAQSEEGFTRFIAIEAANVAGLYLEEAEGTK